MTAPITPPPTETDAVRNEDPVGYIILTETPNPDWTEPGTWAPDWDGELHLTQDAANAEAAVANGPARSNARVVACYHPDVVPSLVADRAKLRAELARATDLREDYREMYKERRDQVDALHEDLERTQTELDAARADADRLRKELERTKSALETARVYGGDVARQLAGARADLEQAQAEAIRWRKVADALCIRLTGVTAEGLVPGPDATPTAAPQPDEPKYGDRSTCTTCGKPIHHLASPIDAWWAHDEHPADGHDAAPAVAGTGQQDTATCECIDEHGDVPHCPMHPYVAEPAAVTPAADKADGSKA